MDPACSTSACPTEARSQQGIAIGGGAPLPRACRRAAASAAEGASWLTWPLLWTPRRGSSDAFLEALGAVDADLVTMPGVMEDWSVRDIVVHVAAWSEHAANALELAESGRGDEFAVLDGARPMP